MSCWSDDAIVSELILKPKNIYFIISNRNCKISTGMVIYFPIFYCTYTYARAATSIIQAARWFPHRPTPVAAPAAAAAATSNRRDTSPSHCWSNLRQSTARQGR